MNPVRLACIVESHGEAEALPVLLRRIMTAIDPLVQLEIPKPVRVPKSKLVKPPELANAVELAARQLRGPGGVLVLLDSDDDCPAALGTALLQRARQHREHLAIAVVLAKGEFEAWFLAAGDSLRGRRGLPHDLQAPTDPEAIRDAKGWLTDRLPPGERYVETLHQTAFTAVFDLELARRAASFDKCYRDVARLLAALR